MKHLIIPTLFFFFLLAPTAQSASPNTLTYEGVLTDSSGNPVNLNGQTVTFSIVNSSNCVIYRETSSTSGDSSGNISHLVGSGTVSYGAFTPALFNQSVSGEGACAVTASDSRLLKIEISTPALSASVPLSSVPYALESAAIGGYQASSLLRAVDGSGNPASAPALNPSQITELNALLGGSSTLYMRNTATTGALLPISSGTPSSATAGSIWFDSGSVKFFDGSTTQTLGTSGGGSGTVTSVIAGTGLNVNSGPGGTITNTGTLNVNVGTNSNQIVQLDGMGQLPSLNASQLHSFSADNFSSGTLAISRGGTGNGSLGVTAGGVVYGDGSKLMMTASGTTGKPLVSGGTGAPLFSALGVAGGGTGATSFTANRLIGTNGTGLGQQSVTCSPYQVLSFDVSGNYGCYYVADVFPGFRDGGNTMTTTAVLGTNSSHNLELETDGTTKMTIKTGGNVGIGTSDPGTKLDVFATDEHVAARILNSNSTSPRYPRLIVGNFIGSASAGHPELLLSNSRGNVAAPAALQVNDVLGTVDFAGAFDGSYSFSISSVIAAHASQNFTSNSTGSELRFSTTANGTTSPQERLRIHESGKVSVGHSAPEALLDVNGTGRFRGPLHVQTAGGQSLINLSQLNMQSHGPATLHFSGGINNTGYPTGDYELGLINFQNSEAWKTGAQILATTSQTHSMAASGGHLHFYTTPNNTVTPVHRMIIAENGRVGIKLGNRTTTPSYDLHVNGTSGGTTNFQAISDRRYKADIRTLAGSLDQILKIRGVQFNWRQSDYPDLNFGQIEDIGVIAQEIESVYPEAVHTNAQGYKSVAYSKLVAPLIESTKELYGMCKMSESEIAKLRTELASVKSENETLKAELSKQNERLRNIEASLGLSGP